MLVGQKAAQERQMLVAPELHLDEIVGAGECRAQQQEQDLRQGIEHLGPLAPVLKRGEVVEQARAGGLVHGYLQSWEYPPSRTRPQHKLTRRSSVCPGYPHPLPTGKLAESPDRAVHTG